MTGNDVTLFDLLLGFDAASWNKSSKDSFDLTFWDPEYMRQWIKRAYKKSEPLTGMSYSPIKRQKAKGLHIDARHVPTPTESFWTVN